MLHIRRALSTTQQVIEELEDAVFSIFFIVKAKGMLSRLKMPPYELEGSDTSFDPACTSLACTSPACTTVADCTGSASTGNQNCILHGAQLEVKACKKYT